MVFGSIQWKIHRVFDNPCHASERGMAAGASRSHMSMVSRVGCFAAKMRMRPSGLVQKRMMCAQSEAKSTRREAKEMRLDQVCGKPLWCQSHADRRLIGVSICFPEEVRPEAL